MKIMIGAFAIGLVITLVLAAFLTPRSWWKRPNVRALAVLAVGTWGIGSLLLTMAPRQAMATTPVTEGIAALRPAPLTAGREYRVFEDLNLRSASGIGARRVTVVPVGAVVTATGARDGDWWEVSAKVGGKPVTGWVSSLWLRRADEHRR
ncbi:MAG: SH3 domain-containing protein [Pseudomonadota bacterium]|nr:SH3 domain-containing protein [Pseudomonadota bacterium]